MEDKTKKRLIILAIAILAFIFVGNSTTLLDNTPLGAGFTNLQGERFRTSTYVTTTDQIVYTGPSFLERIIVWTDGSGGKIAVMDSTSATADTSIFELEDDGLTGSYEVGIDFLYGIVVDVTSATTTIVYSIK